MAATDAGDGGRDLALWSLATFHTVTFVVAVALGFHLKGTLAARLAQLDTALGVAAFVFLWVATWFTTRIGRRYQSREESSGAGPSSIVPAMIVGGAWNGVIVFVVLLIGLVLTRLGSLQIGNAIVGLVLIVVVGGALAFVIGGFVGMAFGIIDRTLLGASRLLFEWAENATQAVFRAQTVGVRIQTSAIGQKTGRWVQNGCANRPITVYAAQQFIPQFASRFVYPKEEAYESFGACTCDCRLPAGRVDGASPGSDGVHRRCRHRQQQRGDAGRRPCRCQAIS